MSDSVSKGFVSVHREIMDHWLWQEKPFSKGQAWIDLILLANYKPEKFPYKNGIVTAQRGTVYRSISSLAERWGWGRDKVRQFLAQLQDDGMITLTATTHQTTITLKNYDKFQIQAATNHTTNRQPTGNKPATNQQQADSRLAASRQQADTYNKDNKVNKVNKDNQVNNYADVIVRQSPEEIKEAQNWFDSI